jgi:HEPN domain-containing protein
MTPSLEEAYRFLDLARADFDAFQVLAGNERVRPAISLFHAQQTAEKSLMAVLFAKQLEFRRTHDLFELADRIQAAGVELSCPVELLGKLNPYAVLFRYDNLDVDAIPLDDADQIAAGVLRWAETIVAGAAV